MANFNQQKGKPQFIIINSIYEKLLLLPALAALVSACSSTPSFTEDVTINSQPQGADVFVNNELVGQTPLTVDLPKDGVYELRLAKKGTRMKL